MSRARRSAVALLCAAAVVVHAESIDVERALRDGEGLLAAGDTAGAQTVFERAAAAGHEPRLEVSLVRAYMQGGEYRRALSFAAHAAGEHADYPAAAALYAWLLYGGGQPQVARRLIGSAPHDAVVRATVEQLAAPSPLAAEQMLQAPSRFAPYSTGSAAGGAVVASATLIDGGRRALAPGRATDGVAVWVRNGLGRTTTATVERRFVVGSTDVALLRLDAPLPAPQGLQAATRPPFAGSVAYGVEFTQSERSASAGWPLLRLGFFGRTGVAGDLPLLGIDVPAGPHGGPVFDEAGRLAGIALRSDDARDRLAAAAALPEELRELLGSPSSGGPTPKLAMDEIYERSLLLTLQLIAEPAR